MPSGSGYVEHIIYRFHDGNDGFHPTAGLIRDAAGNLFGTTYLGGAGGNGVVFELTEKRGLWIFTVLHAFGVAQGDGRFPNASVTEDAAGNLYGTTYNGGNSEYQCGSVYKMTPVRLRGETLYAERVIHSFQCTDGQNPLAPVIVDAAGNLYGTTSEGASGGGTVFELTPTVSGYSETTLQSFTGSNGYWPLAGLLSLNGSLFGTTQFGGPSNVGTVFKITP